MQFNERVTACNMSWFGNIKGEVFAGIVVELVLIPELLHSQLLLESILWLACMLHFVLL